MPVSPAAMAATATHGEVPEGAATDGAIVMLSMNDRVPLARVGVNTTRSVAHVDALWQALKRPSRAVYYGMEGGSSHDSTGSTAIGRPARM